MKLTPNVGSDRSWVWQCAADFSEDPPTEETLAIRVKDADQATQFKEAFERAARINELIKTGEEKEELDSLLAQLAVVETGAGEDAPEEDPDVKQDSDSE